MKRTLVWMGLLLVTAGPIGSALSQTTVGSVAPANSTLDATARLDEEVQAALEVAGPNDRIPVLVYLRDRVDIRAIVRQFNHEGALLTERHERIVRALQEKAKDTQGPLLDTLRALEQSGVAGDVTPLWIVNAITMRATPAAILAIGARDDVYRIFYNYDIELVQPVSMGDSDGGGMRSGPEIGLQAINVPQCWDAGIDGTGVLTSTLDTGVDGGSNGHPALKDRWRGLDDRYSGHGDWAFFDPVTDQTTPFDAGSHGTHTMGTVCGGDPGDQVGVAPGAQWINAAVIDRVSIQQTVADAIKAFQWLIDPDGDPKTNWDVPTACSNSWRVTTGHGYQPCDDTFWEYLDACEAAGIVILFSAGNEGPGSETIGRPPDRATTEFNVTAVGAIDAHSDSWPIASFSSRGPSHCTDDGSEAIKPEICAPGVNVRSSVPGNSYAEYSGTSMASPHTNGVVCLMRQVNPELLVDDVKQILFDTCRDLGDVGDDNTYGHGLVDAYAAVQVAASSAGLHIDLPDGHPKNIDPDGGTKFKFNVTAGPKDTPVPGTGKFFVDTGNGFEESQVDILGENQYQAVFPTSPCDIKVKFYVSADGESGKTYYNPALAPGAYYTATVYNEIGVAYADDFESAKSGFVAAKGVGVTSGKFERVKPVGDPNWPYAPAADSDGSGVCWVTDNRSGESDIDGGCVWITSGALDLSQAVSLRFAYWVYNENDVEDVNGLFVQLSKSSTTGFRDLGHITASEESWHTAEFSRDEMEASLGAKLTNTIYIRFKACDKYNHDHRVEVAIDALKIEAPVCNPHGHKGDMDCDGFVNFNDVDPFVLGLADPGNYAVQYPNCRLLNGDINGDGFFDFNDIDGFVDCLVNGGCP